MLSVLSMKGTQLIPKSPVLNATAFAGLLMRDVGPDTVRVEELEALGERHLGCGHEI
jgi:hypothetical protein